MLLDSYIALIFIGFFIILIPALAILVMIIIGLWKTFKKASKGGWEAIVPGYNGWILFEISGLNWWWFLIYLAPVIASFIPLINGISWLASIFALFNCNYNIAKKFNKGTGFAVCLTLFPYVCFPMLGFSKNNVYNPNAVVSNNGVFEESKNNNVNNYQQQSNNNNQQTPFQNNADNMENSNVAINPTYSFCGNCGTKLDNGIQFCPNCGQKNI